MKQRKTHSGGVASIPLMTDCQEQVEEGDSFIGECQFN